MDPPPRGDTWCSGVLLAILTTAIRVTIIWMGSGKNGMGEYGERPALRVDELPVIKSFLRGSAAPKSPQYSDDFYRMMQQANQVYGSVQRWKRERRLQDSRALQREQRHILASRPRLNRTQQQVRQLNSQIQMIQLHTRLSAEEKRQHIDKLLARHNHLVQQAVKRMNRWFE